MRISSRLLLFAVGMLAVNCLVWGTLLAVCGGCSLGGLAIRPSSPPATAVVQATAVPTPSPTRASSPTRPPSPQPTRWPTASWSTASPTTLTLVRPTSTARPNTPTPWPTQVIQGADATAKAQALMDLAAKGPNIPFRVVFTESEIEQEVERYLAGHPEVPARNVSVALTRPEAVVSGQVRVGGLWVAITVHAGVTVQGGKAVVTITRLDMGSFPLPPSVRDDLTRRLAEALAGTENLPFRFTAITLDAGRVTVQGVTK